MNRVFRIVGNQAGALVSFWLLVASVVALLAAFARAAGRGIVILGAEAAQLLALALFLAGIGAVALGMGA